jgi:hypothetical protein
MSPHILCSGDISGLRHVLVSDVNASSSLDAQTKKGVEIRDNEGKRAEEKETYHSVGTSRLFALPRACLLVRHCDRRVLADSALVHIADKHVSLIESLRRRHFTRYAGHCIISRPTRDCR